MNIKELKELLELIDQSAIQEFEMERSGVRVHIKKASPVAPVVTPVAGATVTAAAAAQAPQAPPAEEEKEAFYKFKAPIVGTFYITPKPDAEPFVRKGDSVHKGMVICIIEAMKLFNQIESDVDGEIVKILVENGQPVEYGEPLFEIRLTS